MPMRASTVMLAHLCWHTALFTREAKHAAWLVTGHRSHIQFSYPTFRTLLWLCFQRRQEGKNSTVELCGMLHVGEVRAVMDDHLACTGHLHCDPVGGLLHDAEILVADDHQRGSCDL